MSRSPAAILYDSYGSPIGAVLDGVTYRLQVEAGLAPGHGLATQSTLLDAYNQLVEIESKDFATETTLLSVGSKVSTEATLLDSYNKINEIKTLIQAIKDFDGIKKITDSLPSGNNIIGQINQASASSPWHVDGVGTAGIPSGGVHSIQGVNSGYPISVVTTSSASPVSFVVLAENIQIGNNKSLIALQNTTGSSYIVRIREMYLTNVRITAITGVVAEFQFKRITSFTGGTSLIPLPHDTSDSLPINITAATGATVSGEATSNLFRKFQSTDEWGVGSPDNEGFDAAVSRLLPVYKQNDYCKSITIRANQGVHLKCATNSTNGYFDMQILFTISTE